MNQLPEGTARAKFLENEIRPLTYCSCFFLKYYFRHSIGKLPKMYCLLSQCSAAKHTRHGNSPWLPLTKCFCRWELVESCRQSVGGQDYCLHLTDEDPEAQGAAVAVTGSGISAHYNLFSGLGSQYLRSRCNTVDVARAICPALLAPGLRAWSVIL